MVQAVAVATAGGKAGVVAQGSAPVVAVTTDASDGCSGGSRLR